jgi:hypothetical protein
MTPRRPLGGDTRRATIHLGGDAEKVARALRAIAVATVDRRLRGNTAHCAGRMRRQMDRRDVQQVIWLLQSARRCTSMPRAQRRAASYWAARLKAQI